MSTPDHTFKIIVVGPASAGKTCFVNRFVEGKFPQSAEPTVALDLKVKTIQFDGQNIRLNIWDTAGQERYRSVVDLYYRGMHGCLGLFDITSYTSFEDLKREIENIREFYEIDGERIIIVGNKSDLDAKRQVSLNEIIDFTSQIKSTYIEASAKTGRNVEKAFLQLVQNVIDIVEVRGMPERRSTRCGSLEIQRKNSYLESENLNLKKTKENKGSAGCC